MDEHTIKKKKYLTKIFAITSGFPSMMAHMVEIVKAYPIYVLDLFFSRINVSGLELYNIYNTTCNKDNDEFVKYVIENMR